MTSDIFKIAWQYNFVDKTEEEREKFKNISRSIRKRSFRFQTVSVDGQKQFEKDKGWMRIKKKTGKKNPFSSKNEYAWREREPMFPLCFLLI